MRPILILGGLGYIGSRLCQALSDCEVQVVDADIYGAGLGPLYEELPTSAFRGKVVVNLASFHREADNLVNRGTWARQYMELLVHEPLALSECAHKLVNVSSMRSLEDQSLYGLSKRAAEQKMCAMSNVQHVRLGTVWGGFEDDLPNRFSTAVNFALSRGYFEGDTYASHVTHMDRVILFLETYVRAHATHNETIFDGTTVNILDSNTKLTAKAIRLLLRGRHDDPDLQLLFDKERGAFNDLQDPDLLQDVHAQERGWNRYGLRRTTSTPKATDPDTDDVD